jgi:hypothetical protein
LSGDYSNPLQTVKQYNLAVAAFIKPINCKTGEILIESEFA